MLSIGWPEMLIVAAAALIVVGPKDLPAMLRTLGQVMGRVRRMSNDFRREINRVAALDDVKEIRSSLSDPLKDAQKSIESEFNKIGKDGKVEPSGAIKPTDPKVESVYDQLKASTAPVEAKEPLKTGPASKSAGDSRKTASGKARAKPAAQPAAKPKEAAKAKTTGKSAATEPSATKAPRSKKAAASSTAATGAASRKPASKAKSSESAQ